MKRATEKTTSSKPTTSKKSKASKEDAPATLIFSGLTFYFVPGSKYVAHPIKKFKEIALKHGAKLETSIRQCTHMITTIEKIHAGFVADDDIDRAKLHLRVVNENFVLDCIEKNELLPVDNYVLRKKKASEEAPEDF